MRTADPGRARTRRSRDQRRVSQTFFLSFLRDFLFVTRVAAAFVVAFELFEGTAFGEIFFSAI
jgi:hypothetical protein